ncbi:SAF domain-containing protein [Streptomyces sp. NPDC059009]|uniref:SAF domain-containing protein n=1 Tax=Streptomyces sp. NPDC059009 TaxID=3346694 RepID=UPI0036A967E4
MESIRRRRRVPHLLLGVLLVAGCATGGVVAGTRLGDREPVLALARPVDVGQELTRKDLREVSLAKDSGLAVIPAGSASRVTGRTVAYSLPAGALLTRDVLGAAKLPKPGRAVAAIGLKPGQYPPGLERGNPVRVVIAPEAGDRAESPRPTESLRGVVADVRGDEREGTTVVSVDMIEDDARRLAAAPAGQVSVVLVRRGAR